MKMNEMIEKPLWIEGMLLTQQHFQAWEGYLFHQIQLNQTLSSQNHWGLIDLELDQTSVSRGLLNIEKVSLRFPGSNWVTQKENLHYQLASKPGETEIFCLAQPNNSRTNALSGYVPASSELPGWQTVYQERSDLYDESKRHELVCGTPNLYLMPLREIEKNFLYCPVAEVSYQANGEAFLTDFIPPLLSISLSTDLIRDIAAIKFQIERLKKECSSMKINHAQQVFPFLCQQEVFLSACLTGVYSHPWEIYQRSLEFLSVISSFYPQESVSFLSHGYRHDDLRGTFSSVFETTQVLLQQMLRRSSRTFYLKQESEVLYVLDELDEEFFQSENVWLVFESCENDCEKIVSSQIKVTAHQEISSVIAAGLFAVPLERDCQKETKINRICFQLDTRSHAWELVKKEKSLAVYAPSPLNQKQFYLLADHSEGL